VSAQDTRGFTVIEVLVAMLILGVGITALVGSSALVTRQIGRGRILTIATEIGNQRLEKLRLLSRPYNGAAACARLAILFIVVIVVVEPLWGSTRGANGPALVIGASDPSAHVYLHGTPGGVELNRKRDPDPLVANTPYRFSCQVKLSDGSRWLRLADANRWAPAAVLLTNTGRPAPEFPTC